MLKLFLYCILSVVAAVQLSAQIPGIPSDVNSNKYFGKKSAADDKNAEARRQAREKLLARRKIVLEQILADIHKVNASEKRADYLSAAGKTFCLDGDKPKAFELFEKALKEYYQARKASEKIKDEKSLGIRYGGAARIQIIQNINDCDSELAYQYLLKTRPQIVSESLNAIYRDPTYSPAIPALSNTVSWEIIRETNLKSEILGSKSDRLEEFINGDLNTFISDRTLSALNQLSYKNPSLASELAEKAVEKLLVIAMFAPVTKKPINMFYLNSFRTAVSFLKASETDSKNNPYKIKISNASSIKLADKITKEAIDAQSLELFNEELKIIQRLLPDRYAQYEQMKAEKLRTPKEIEKQNLRKLLKRDVAVEKLLLDARNYTEKNQKQIYIAAACRSIAGEDLKLAADILNENLPDRVNADKRLSLALYSLAIGSLKLEKRDYLKAEKLIGQMTDPQLQIDALGLLAQILYKKDKINNKEKALSLLSDAMKTFREKSDVINQYEAFSDIVLGYSIVDPETAFPLFDSLLNPKVKFKDNDEKINKYFKIEDLSQLAIYGVAANYFKGNIIAALNESSFEKTLKIIEKNSSIESKIINRLNLLGNKFSFYDFRLRQTESYCR